MENFLEVMQKWYQQASGSWVLTLESEELSRILKNIRGVYLVQMGGSLDLAHSKKSPIFTHIQLTSQFINNSILSIQTGWRELPLLPNSVDVIVLVHLLEFIDYPVKLLQEIFHALKPNGQLIILGFNPWSLWGLKKTFSRGVPWKGKFWSRAQVKRWLINFNYSILYSKTFCHGLPSQKKLARQTRAFIETAAQLALPASGGIYLLVAKKKVYAPIQPEILWAKRRFLTRGVIEPTTRM